MGKDKEITVGWDEELEAFHPVNKEDVILEEQIDEVDEFEEVEIDEADEIEQPLKIRVFLSANLRKYPHHASHLIKRVRKDTVLDVKEVVTGSLVQLTNIWYEVEGGFIHASQVELL